MLFRSEEINKMGKGALGKERLLVGFHGLCGRSCAHSGLFHDLTSFQEVSNTYLSSVVRQDLVDLRDHILGVGVHVAALVHDDFHVVLPGSGQLAPGAVRTGVVAVPHKWLD